MPAPLVELTRGERGLHGAPGLGAVAAVGEPAGRDEQLDVGEGEGHPFAVVVQPDRAQTGGVDEHPATAERDELAGGRRVPALAVLPGVGDGLELLPRKGVDERRLAGAGLPDERGRPTGEHRGEDVDALAGLCGDDVDVDPGGGRLDLGAGGIGVEGEVGLRQHDERLRPGLPGDDEVALDRRQVDPRLEGDRDQHVVEVGRHDLGVGPLTGGRADDRGAPRQDHSDDVTIGATLQPDPVAGRRLVLEIAARRQPDERRHCPVRGVDGDPAAVDPADATRLQGEGSRPRHVVEGRGARLVPAEGGEGGGIRHPDHGGSAPPWSANEFRVRRACGGSARGRDRCP